MLVPHILTLVLANERQEDVNSDLDNNRHFTNLNGKGKVVPVAFHAGM